MYLQEIVNKITFNFTFYNYLCLISSLSSHLQDRNQQHLITFTVKESGHCVTTDHQCPGTFSANVKRLEKYFDIAHSEIISAFSLETVTCCG